MPESVAFKELGEHWENMDVDNVPIWMESVTPPPLFFDDKMWSCLPLSPQVQIRQESITPPPLNFNDEEVLPAFHPGKWKEREGETLERVGDPNNEEWEAELDESFAPGTSEIWDWLTLHAQIKADLKKAKSLPLSQINQLMIVQNFATLCLKGLGKIVTSKEIARQWHDKLDGSSDHFSHHIRVLTWHYQSFEQLLRCEGRHIYC